MIYGMDPETVLALASRMAEVADRVRAVESRLTSGLASTDWVGRDRDRFEAEWTSQHVLALRRAAEALDDAARVAAAEAREQDRASA